MIIVLKKHLLEGLQKRGLSDFKYFPYDPVFPEYGNPEKADLVCCIDVLEHVEPEYIMETLVGLKDLTNILSFLTIHMGPPGKFLDDGRNAHLIQDSTS